MDLTFAQLESSLLAVLPPVPPFSFWIFDYFTNLYNIGCRPTELHKLTNWEAGPGSDYILKPSKNNNNRFIAASAMTTYLKDQIDSGAPNLYPASYEKFLYWFEKLYEFQPCFVGARSIDLYLFRHHYVKKLFNDGMSVPLITLHMGWINPLMAENYINSVISTP